MQIKRALSRDLLTVSNGTSYTVQCIYYGDINQLSTSTGCRPITMHLILSRYQDMDADKYYSAGQLGSIDILFLISKFYHTVGHIYILCYMIKSIDGIPVIKMIFYSNQSIQNALLKRSVILYSIYLITYI